MSAQRGTSELSRDALGSDFGRLGSLRALPWTLLGRSGRPLAASRSTPEMLRCHSGRSSARPEMPRIAPRWVPSDFGGICNRFGAPRAIFHRFSCSRDLLAALPLPDAPNAVSAAPAGCNCPPGCTQTPFALLLPAELPLPGDPKRCFSSPCWLHLPC